MGNYYLRFVLFLSLFFLVMSKDLLLIASNAPLMDTRLDPIVNPGRCSSHVHSVFGAASFGSTVERSDITGDVETSNNVEENKSMYWAPSLYIWNPSDKLYYLVPTFSRVYYRMQPKNENDPSTVNPFPLDLRLVVGDAKRMKEWRYDDEHDNVRWTRGNQNRKSTNSKRHGTWSYMREDKIVAQELEMNALFPDCLAVDKQGKPVTDSRDHRSHAVYSKKNGDPCPESHPYQIPIVNLEVRYEMTKMKELLGANVANNIDNWVLSTGDRTGASAHVDFISGWPEDLMADIILHCRSSKGEDCPIEDAFDISRGKMREKEVTRLKPIPDEKVSPIPELLIFPDGDCPRKWLPPPEA